MHFDAGIAGVDQAGGKLLAAIHDLDGANLPRVRPVGIVAQGDDSVLHRDEVAMAEISSGAVVGLAEVVGRVKLDEARTAVAQQMDRKQSHLALQLLLDLRHHPVARALGRHDVGLVLRPRGLSAGPGRNDGIGAAAPTQLSADLGADRVDLRVVGAFDDGVAVAGVNDPERIE